MSDRGIQAFMIRLTKQAVFYVGNSDIPGEKGKFFETFPGKEFKRE